MKIAVIDSGVNIEYQEFHAAKFEIVNFVNNDMGDECGHGTACCGEIVNWTEDADFLIIKILDEKNKSSLDILYKALSYCIHRDDIIIINMSCAWNLKDIEINNICNDLIQKLCDSGKIIVSAFDNDKTKENISYPAAFLNTWGIRHEYDTSERIDYDLFDRRCTFYGDYNLMPYKNGKYKFFKGNSSFSARFAGIIYYYMTKMEERNICNIFKDFNYRLSERTEIGIGFTIDDLFEILLMVNHEKYNRYEERNKWINRFSALVEEDECVKILKAVEQNKNVALNYLKFTCEDFRDVYKLIGKINRYGKK